MPAKKRRLGRGLDSLLGPDTTRPTAPGRGDIRHIPVAQLQPNPYQPRHMFDPEALAELAASIQAQGILQPLVVRAMGQGYEIVAGERRWRAAQQVGRHEVPALVRDLTNQEMLEVALIENLQRDALNPIEEARAYRQLIESFELTQEQVADRVGKSRVAVTNSLRLLRLPDQVLQWVETGRLSAGHARALLALDKAPTQIALAREVMVRGLNVREVERKVRQILNPPPRPRTQPEGAAALAQMEDRLREALGLRVRIQSATNHSGRIEVYYTTLDEFQRFCDRLGIPTQEEL